jgi:hypothetical protein
LEIRAKIETTNCTGLTNWHLIGTEFIMCCKANNIEAIRQKVCHNYQRLFVVVIVVIGASNIHIAAILSIYQNGEPAKSKQNAEKKKKTIIDNKIFFHRH